jgi:hypothetical protein
MCSMSSVIDTFRECLDQLGFGYGGSAEGATLHAEYCGQAGRFPIVIRVNDDATLVFVEVIVPLMVPEGFRPRMAEAVVRANDHLAVGCFELTQLPHPCAGDAVIQGSTRFFRHYATPRPRTRSSLGP